MNEEKVILSLDRYNELYEKSFQKKLIDNIEKKDCIISNIVAEKNIEDLFPLRYQVQDRGGDDWHYFKKIFGDLTIRIDIDRTVRILNFSNINEIPLIVGEIIKLIRIGFEME